MAGAQACSQCSAPLTLGAPGTVVVCQYCRTENRIGGLTGAMPIAQMPPSYDPPSVGVPVGHAEQQKKLRIVLGVVIALFTLPFCFGIAFQIVIMILAALGIAVGAVAAGHAH
jgi:hypothetical protein